MTHWIRTPISDREYAARKRAQRRASWKKHSVAELAKRKAERRENPEVLQKERQYRAKAMRTKLYIVRRKTVRAKAEGVEWGLGTPEQAVDLLHWPTHCPVLGIELNYGSPRKPCAANNPSLDRHDNSKTYAPGNVFVISYRANSLKSDATVTELWQVYRYAKDGKGLFRKEPSEPSKPETTWEESTPELDAKITEKFGPPPPPPPEPKPGHPDYRGPTGLYEMFHGLPMPWDKE
jgi:hypothetical protein